WWKEAVIYQIYPWSFNDSNGDGIGDIQGIISKLGYLKELGVDVLWLNPVYPSPNDDNGYDIANYRDIMPEFGTLADWEELLAETHRLGMKLIMDLVINHTSDEHAWFVESRSAVDHPKRDYYIWRKGANGREPNNWRSYFTPSAWEYDSLSQEYYLHLFSKKQPDLNWSNPRVKEEIFDMIRWWLDKGIDGFRMDVINILVKAPGLPDSLKNDPSGYVFDEDLYANQPGIHELLREMNQQVLSHYDIMTVGETVNVTPEEALLYVGEERRELNMVFQFELMGLDSGPKGKWDLAPWRLSEFKRIFSQWQLAMGDSGWNSLYLNNHDQPRMVSRFGDDQKYRRESAKMLATLLHTAKGSPFIYQGEEIGMTNVRFPDISQYRDLESLNMYQEQLAGGQREPEIMQAIYAKGRDNARTPMQWSGESNAGFTSGQPWIEVNSNFREINVQKDMENPDSIWNYYRKLIRLRKENPVIIYGDYQPLLEEHPQIMAYRRRFADQELVILLNFNPAVTEIPGEIVLTGKPILIGNYPADRHSASLLRPYEARVYRVQ
ncbi:MAG TPA: glucohydrolase, partial [Firmicutes bacterium]|nr:glucohydrolase [Bacillota bacterium]